MSVGPDIADRALIRLRRLALVNVVVLTVWRLVRDADDFNNWDLIPFLNANSWPTLRGLLERHEIHFQHPFTFPLYNVGAESVVSALFFRAFGGVSLYWSNVVILLIYDAVLLVALYGWIRLLFRDRFGEATAWLLAGMSPVLLTFMSTSAFNVQGYAAIAVALLGTEYLLQGKLVRGTLVLALAFCFIAQGYPLSFFMPYYVVAWVGFRLVVRRLPVRPDGTPSPLGNRVAWSVVCLALLAGAAVFVNWMSSGVYFGKISPVNPHDAGNQLVKMPSVLERASRFARQAFWPPIRVDGVPFGFAPYFVWTALAVVTLMAFPRLGRVRLATRWSMVAGLLAVAAAAGLVTFGYVPSFIYLTVKSQRSVFGDLFLVVVVAYWLWRTTALGLVSRRAVIAVLLALLMVFDVFYVRAFTGFDHSRNHSPVFDFDLSDGPVRHDLVAAIALMRRQVEEENGRVIVVYPRRFSENTTDPAMFFARFLRHWGPYRNQRTIEFPCRWCDVRYGCPFPNTLATQKDNCANVCCWHDPVGHVRHRMPGRRVFLWWHRDQGGIAKTPSLADVSRRLRRHYTLIAVPLPPPIAGWFCYEVVPRADEGGAG